jgi:ParB-like nuclease domain
MTTDQRDPFHLRLHPLHERVPKPDKASPLWRALILSVEAAGILQPLIITDNGRIMDGAWRWEAAKALRFPAVPCVIRPDHEAAAIVVETLVHRKQMTRGAAVYLMLPALKEFLDSAEDRRMANLKQGKKCGNPLKVPNGSTLPFGKCQELCEYWGIDHKTLDRAVEVQKIFEKDPDLKSELEPQLLNGEKNLWNILSYVGGAETDQTQRGFRLLESSFKNLRAAAGTWNDLTRAERDRLLQSWRDHAGQLPPTMRHAMLDVLAEKEGRA